MMAKPGSITRNGSPKAIKDSGKSELHMLTPEQKKAWQVAMQPTWQWAEGRVGKEVIAIMQKAASS